MTDLDKKLSVLLDDYAAEADVDAAIGEAVADVNLQYRLRRYRLIGEVMRNELPRAIDTDFHATVMARVRAEAAAQPRPARDTVEAAAAVQSAGSLFARGWLKPITGLALAAGVAVVTVSLWQPARDQIDGPVVTTQDERVRQLAEQYTAPVVRASTNVQNLGTRWKVEQDNPQLQQKLNAYLVNHTEYSNSVQGLIPQARVAGFDTPRQ